MRFGDGLEFDGSEKRRLRFEQSRERPVRICSEAERCKAVERIPEIVLDESVFGKCGGRPAGPA